MSERTETLRRLVEVLHTCTASYIASQPVTEPVENSAAWSVQVEIFDIQGHPKTSRCYAWDDPFDAGTQCVTVLEIPPVSSAQTAVQQVIAVRNARQSSVD
ncbi:MAG: hypothetical protein ABSE62_16195 [Chthoniobacteraceae bacterium]|jgi:hypothetical protein